MEFLYPFPLPSAIISGNRYNVTLPVWSMRLRTLVALLMLSMPAPAGARSPSVVVSIAPLHSLVSALMEGVEPPQLLLPANVSPHAYSMKPSQAHALGHATLIFWVGPGLETFLVKPLQALGGNTNAIAMQDIPGILTLPLRAGGVWEEVDSGDGHDHADHQGWFDPHLWLDIGNAKAFTATAAEALMRSDPDNAAAYEANRDRLYGALDDLDRELRTTLQPVTEQPFLVFHDAYQYFEARYGLTVTGSVTVAADRQPGARRIQELRERIRQSHVACVFREPQFSPRLIQPVIDGLSVRIGVLDPLGGEQAGGPQQYFLMMRALGRVLHDCLAASMTMGKTDGP